MIKIISLNPAIDKHIEVNEFNYARLNIVNDVKSVAGGKGLNIAKIIKSLKTDCVLYTLIGGRNGVAISDYCALQNIELRYVEIKNETRENLKIAEVDGTLTEFNIPGQPVSKIEIEKFEKLVLNDANKKDLYIISGSLPTGIDSSFYRELIKKIIAKGSVVLLDTSGDSLMKAVSAKPLFIKPNLYELEKLFLDKKFTTITEISEAAKSLTKFGIQHVLVSMGEMGSILISDKKVFYGDALSLKVKKVVGAGDAMVAAFAIGLENNLTVEEIYKNSIACASAWIETDINKNITAKQVVTLAEKVTISTL